MTVCYYMYMYMYMCTALLWHKVEPYSLLCKVILRLITQKKLDCFLWKAYDQLANAIEPFCQLGLYTAVITTDLGWGLVLLLNYMCIITSIIGE